MGVAAFFYLTMTTGATAGLVEGRTFYWGRYIDWVITTSLLLLDPALLALPNWRRNAGLIAGLIALDVFMTLTGLLAGSGTSEFARGFWFLVSTAATVALLTSSTLISPSSQPRASPAACRASFAPSRS